MTGASTLCLRNRQQAVRLNLTLLRRMLRTLLETLRPNLPYELCIHLVAPNEIAALNERYLDHVGPTDVIAFNHGDPPNGPGAPQHSRERLHGEIFICPAMALQQAPRFDATWQTELARYATHGLLHLCGHDDLSAAPRRKMKREEDRLLGILCARFDVEALGSAT